MRSKDEHLEIDAATLPWVDEAAAARAHPMIFHYTSAVTLESILTSGGLIATRVDHEAINDPNELRAPRDTLISLMQQAATPLLEYAKSTGKLKVPEELDLAKLINDEAANFHDIMLSALPLVPHITCFCAHPKVHHQRNGLLTMWRLYGDKEGISLGFDTAKIVQETEKIIKHYAIDCLYVEPVLYGSEDATLIQRVLDSPEVTRKFADFLILLFLGEERDINITTSAFTKFVVLVSGAKLPDFSDEREIRLIAWEAGDGHEKGREKPLTIAPGKLVLKYLSALRSVMVGPSKSQDETARSVRQLLDAHGFQEVEVLRSHTQFRFVR